MSEGVEQGATVLTAQREFGENAAAVELVNVSKNFRGPTSVKTVVHDLSLTIGAGEFFSLLGPSGCGKTTTLRMIAGLEKVDGGKIFLGGTDATNVPSHSRNVNTVFQNYALFPHLSVFDNVAYGLHRQHVEKTELRRRVKEALNLVHMDNYAMHRPASTLRRPATARRPRAFDRDSALGATPRRTAWRLSI